MKQKTVQKILNSKFDDFVESIKDDRTKDLVKNNTIITGGCIASMLMHDKVNDFDLYFTNKETVLSVSKYYVNKFNLKNETSGKVVDGSNISVREEYNLTEDRVNIIFQSIGEQKEKGIDTEDIHELGDTVEVPKSIDDKNDPYRPVYISSNAITLSNDIQIIIRFYGEADQIHDNYDFVHCTNYWTSKDRSIVLNQKALESLLSKDLFYVGSKYPLASLIRIRKFIQRGWTISAGQILKIAFQLQDFDLTNPRILEEQLTGVDLAYFMMLIDAIKESDEKKLTYSYLAEIIDRIF